MKEGHPSSMSICKTAAFCVVLWSSGKLKQEKIQTIVMHKFTPIDDTPTAITPPPYRLHQRTGLQYIA
jgi:hypothetical protein